MGHLNAITTANHQPKSPSLLGAWAEHTKGMGMGVWAVKLIIITSITKLYSTSTPKTYKTYLSTGYRSNCRPYRLLGDQPTTMKLERPTLMKKNNRWIQSGFQHVTPILNSSKSCVIIAGIRPETNAPTSLRGAAPPGFHHSIAAHAAAEPGFIWTLGYFSPMDCQGWSHFHWSAILVLYPILVPNPTDNFNPSQTEPNHRSKGREKDDQKHAKNPCWLTGILHYISITFNNSLERTYHGEYICIYTYR